MLLQKLVVDLTMAKLVRTFLFDGSFFSLAHASFVRILTGTGERNGATH
jgi:hypothetical protein